MFYEPGKSKHGLPHDPFKSCVIPRPIGWISTLSKEGIANLAPYSQFQQLTFDPPYVMFAANQNSLAKRKDSVENAEQTGEFVWNMATYDLRDAVNKSGEEVGPEIDEFEISGLPPIDCVKVKPPRVKESKVSFECSLNTVVEIGEAEAGAGFIVIGTIVMFHIDDRVYNDGHIDLEVLNPIGRLAGNTYTRIIDNFDIVRQVKPK